MKITENSPIKAQSQTALDKFSEKTFTLELTGFEVVALRLIAGYVGGLGKVRSVFSFCGKNQTNFCAELSKIDGCDKAFADLRKLVTADFANSVTVSDNL